MDNLHYQVIKGHPESAAPLLEGAVATIKKQHRAARYKIGITNNPKLRHRHRSYRSYHAMIVLYQTEIRDHVEEMERILIASFMGDKFLANQRGGGAGRKSEPPYYLYVAIRKPYTIVKFIQISHEHLKVRFFYGFSILKDKKANKWKKLFLGIPLALVATLLAISGYVIFPLLISFFDVECTRKEGDAASLSATLSLDGKYLLSSSGYIAELWNSETRQRLCKLEGHKGFVLQSALSRDSRYAVTVGRDNTVRVWDIPSCRILTKINGHGSSVRDASLSPDGKLLAVAEDDWLVHLYLVESGVEIRKLGGLPGLITSVAFSPEGLQILASYYPQHSAMIIDIKSGQIVRQFSGHTDKIFSAIYSHDGKLIATASGDKSIRIWNAFDGKLIRHFSGHTAAVRMVRFSADDTKIVSASDDQTARIWSAPSGSLIAFVVGHKKEVTAADFSPDGSKIITSSYDGSVVLWDAQTGELLHRFKSILLCIRNPAAC